MVFESNSRWMLKRVLRFSFVDFPCERHAELANELIGFERLASTFASLAIGLGRTITIAFVMKPVE
jgi:hypothetical protein